MNDFAIPRTVENLEDCLFYHVMEIPGVGVVDGRWDLRPTIEDYLGHEDYRGKRVLDVGAAGGYLTFEMERRGADVVSLDMRDGDDWHLVPFAHPDYDFADWRARFREWDRQLKNAYWFAHRRLASRARAFYGDIFSLPDGIGDFDLAMFGMVLPHIRDPFQALFSVSRRVRETIVVTQQAPQIEEAYAFFMPDVETLSPNAAWWSMSEACVRKMLAVVGFEVERIDRCAHLCIRREGDRRADGEEMCSTFVARRVRSAP